MLHNIYSPFLYRLVTTSKKRWRLFPHKPGIWIALTNRMAVPVLGLGHKRSGTFSSHPLGIQPTFKLWLRLVNYERPCTELVPSYCSHTEETTDRSGTPAELTGKCSSASQLTCRADEPPSWAQPTRTTMRNDKLLFYTPKIWGGLLRCNRLVRQSTRYDPLLLASLILTPSPLASFTLHQPFWHFEFSDIPWGTGSSHMLPPLPGTCSQQAPPSLMPTHCLFFL